MSTIEYIILVFNVLICLPSVASMTTFDYWWVRVFDFPRIQIALLIILNIILGLFVYSFSYWFQTAIILVLVASLIYQCWLILPYTILWTKQVMKYGGVDNDNEISILVSNVLTENREYHRLIDLIKLKDPDVFLTLESDDKWEEALSVLESSYGYSVKVPLDNLYGMHLYSKLALEETEVKYLIKEHIPSIHGKIKLANGKRASFHCLHPRPPSPSESDTSTNRDAELLLVGKHIDKDAELVLVFGDLNDVAWSRTTKMFQKISGLMDPRRGRGFFNTFTTKNRIMRWPLDHVFHSSDFTLIKMSRETDIGSDHFPMYIKLNYTPKAKWEQDNLNASESDEEWSEEKIEKGEKTTKND